MRLKNKAAFIVLLALVGAVMWSACGGNDDDEFEIGVTMRISHFDDDRDGTPETRLYKVAVVEDDDELLREQPWVVLPNGAEIATSCRYVDADENTLCETAYQVPPNTGTKADIPTGLYNIINDDGFIASFSVDATHLAEPDPKYADTVTFNPAPGAIGDPAVLDWDTTAGAAGSLWLFEIINEDGADDNGKSVSGRSEWADSNFSADLPDDWEVGDALAIEIISVLAIDRGSYVQIIDKRTMTGGFTR